MSTRSHAWAPRAPSDVCRPTLAHLAPRRAHPVGPMGQVSHEQSRVCGAHYLTRLGGGRCGGLNAGCERCALACSMSASARWLPRRGNGARGDGAPCTACAANMGDRTGIHGRCKFKGGYGHHPVRAQCRDAGFVAREHRCARSGMPGQYGLSRTHACVGAESPADPGGCNEERSSRANTRTSIPVGMTGRRLKPFACIFGP